MGRQCNEAQIILALQALQMDASLSVREAARRYTVDRRTLDRRRNGVSSIHDCTPKSRKLTDSEEKAVLELVLDMDSKGFPPRPTMVREMADHLRRVREASPVGDNWTTNFIRRRSELKSSFTRKYDYTRALCEDPKIIQDWFDLVANFKAKHGIQEEDVYNFDEAGFMIGQIDANMVVTGSNRRGKPKAVQPGNRDWVSLILGVNSQGWSLPPYLVVKGKNHLASWYEERVMQPDWRVHLSENGWTTNEIGLDWIKHFDKHTKGRTKGAKRLLILDGHESHHSALFEQYCKNNSIETLAMPPHSSHLLQPLDVGCFSPLKKAYGGEIDKLIRAHITHITKEDLFPAFRVAFDAAITKSNIQAGFRGAGLTPFDPQRVIGNLDVRLRTPISSRPSSRESQSWTSKTPQTHKEASSQLKYMKTRLARHQNSSPTALVQSMEQFERGMTCLLHGYTLMQAQLDETREANRLVSKRRRTKKTRLREGGSLSQQDADGLKAQKEVTQQIMQEEGASSTGCRRVETTARRCGVCGQTGHNARTCRIDVETSREEDSD